MQNEYAEQYFLERGGHSGGSVRAVEQRETMQIQYGKIISVETGRHVW